MTGQSYLLWAVENYQSPCKLCYTSLPAGDGSELPALGCGELGPSVSSVIPLYPQVTGQSYLLWAVENYQSLCKLSYTSLTAGDGSELPALGCGELPVPL